MASTSLPRWNMVISSGNSAPTSMPISRVASTRRIRLWPVTAKAKYSSVALKPPTTPRVASTQRKAVSAHFSSGFAHSAPSPRAATYPATIKLVSTIPPPLRLVESEISASS